MSANFVLQTKTILLHKAIAQCMDGYTCPTSRLSSLPALLQPWAPDLGPASTHGNGDGAGALGWRRARCGLVLSHLSWCGGMQAGSPQLPPFCHLHQHSHLLRVPLWERIHRRWHTALQPDVRVLTYKCVALFIRLSALYQDCYDKSRKMYILKPHTP